MIAESCYREILIKTVPWVECLINDQYVRLLLKAVFKFYRNFSRKEGSLTENFLPAKQMKCSFNFSRLVSMLNVYYSIEYN